MPQRKIINKLKGGRISLNNDNKVLLKLLINSTLNYLNHNSLGIYLSEKKDENSYWIIEQNDDKTFKLRTSKQYFSQYYYLCATPSNIINTKPIEYNCSLIPLNNKEDLLLVKKTTFYIDSSDLSHQLLHKNTYEQIAIIRKIYYNSITKKFESINKDINVGENKHVISIEITDSYKSFLKPNTIIKEIVKQQKDKPLLIYFMGHENSKNIARINICRILRQIDFFKKYCLIDNERINIIFGTVMNNDLFDNTCNKISENFKFNSKKNEPIPYNIDINYINNLELNEINATLINILELKANKNTPIIFFYDGHGIYDDYDNTNNGNLYIRGQINNDKNNEIKFNPGNLYTIFEKHKDNPKLFIFSQCYSLNFADRLEKIMHVNDKSVIYSATNSIHECSQNLDFIKEFEKVIINTKKQYFQELHKDNNTLFNKRLIIHDTNETTPITTFFLFKEDN
jgi:hypothetical protein